MKRTRVISVIFLVFLANTLYGSPKHKEFLKHRYKYIVEIDSLLLINDSTFLEVKNRLDQLTNLNDICKLKKKDLLLLNIYVKRVKLIISLKTKDISGSDLYNAILKAKQIDLYRDYALASAQIQARFERKYLRLKKKGKRCVPNTITDNH